MSLWPGDCALRYLQERWHRGISQSEEMGISESVSAHPTTPGPLDRCSVTVLLVWRRAASSLPISNNPGNF